MVEKAFQVAVSGDIPDNEFTWDDTKDLGRLARKLVSTQPLDSSRYTFVVPNKAALTVSADSIDLRINTQEASHPVIPLRLGLWHGLQVWLDEALPPDRRHPSTILQFRDSFASVQKALRDGAQVIPDRSGKAKGKAAPAQPRRERMKMLPDPGDTVEIVIDPSVPVNQGPNDLPAGVEEGFRGTGSSTV